MVYAAAKPLFSIIVSPAFYSAWSVVYMPNICDFSFFIITYTLYIMKKIYLVIVPQFFAAATALICFLYLFDHGPVGAALSVLMVPPSL